MHIFYIYINKVLVAIKNVTTCATSDVYGFQSCIWFVRKPQWCSGQVDVVGGIVPSEQPATAGVTEESMLYPYEGKGKRRLIRRSRCAIRCWYMPGGQFKLKIPYILKILCCGKLEKSDNCFPFIGILRLI